MRSHLAAWQRHVERYGPGTLDLGLENLATSAEARDQLRSILDAITLRLESSGPTVPAAELNQRCRAPGVRFFEYPSELLANAIARIQALITER